jgi:hypothetical protein
MMGTKITKRAAKKSAIVTVDRAIDEHIRKNPDRVAPTEKQCLADPRLRKTGVYSGDPIAKFQQWMMLVNDGVTDDDLVSRFNIEFPRSNVVRDHGGIPKSYFTSIRTQYNSGTHSGMTTKPNVMSPKWILGADGANQICPTWLKKNSDDPRMKK